ncbi:FAD-binding protein [Mycobacterium sp. pW049]|uniref:FAD-binding protein n=1 Tax=[Mycobacterium] bulgaricum TaxID=3238985 RepID=UPI00351AB8A0
MKSWRDSLPTLQANTSGRTFSAETPGYDDALAVFNTCVRHRPAVVVTAAGPDDVREAVTFASRHGLRVAVLHTGHGPTVAAGDDTLMISTRNMVGVEIDAMRRVARVQAGLRFGQLVDVAAAFGLAPLAGSAPSVGVVGYTLAGGASPTLGRKFGWASDHVSAIDVVTSDGRLRRATARADADLFGALLGGKSNFGVVTAMEFALFPVEQIYAGSLFYAGEHTRSVLEAYRQFTVSAPDDISTAATILNFPPLPDLPPFMQGKKVVALRISFSGDPRTGRRLIDPLRRAAPRLLDTVAEIPYSAFATITQDPTEPAAAVEHFGLLRELTDGTVEAIAGLVESEAGSQMNIIDFRHLQGAFSRPSPVTNAVGGRDAAFAFFGLTVVPPDADVRDYQSCGSELVAALAPWLHPQAHPSFLGPADATERGTRRAYDAGVYAHLREVKAKYDPHNIFRVNHNVPPAVA